MPRKKLAVINGVHSNYLPSCPINLQIIATLQLNRNRIHYKKPQYIGGKTLLTS